MTAVLAGLCLTSALGALFYAFGAAWASSDGDGTAPFYLFLSAVLGGLAVTLGVLAGS